MFTVDSPEHAYWRLTALDEPEFTAELRLRFGAAALPLPLM